VTARPTARTPEDTAGRRGWWAVALVLVGTLAMTGTAVTVVRDRNPAAADFRYEIPLGTGNRVDAGEEVAIVPSELRVRPGDRLTIVNDDERLHDLGVFTVRPGETASFVFPSPGVFLGACSVHPAGTLTIYVE